MARTIRVQQGERLRHRRQPPGAPAVSAAYPRLRAAVRATLDHQNIEHAEISITLLDDDEIAELNRRYLAHDGATDVISFALFDDDEDPVGDVYLGYAQAHRQAAQLGVPVMTELCRLAVHGTLHVLGYDHPPGEERLESDMWRVQEEILRRSMTVDG